MEADEVQDIVLGVRVRDEECVGVIIMDFEEEMVFVTVIEIVFVVLIIFDRDNVRVKEGDLLLKEDVGEFEGELDVDLVWLNVNESEKDTDV
jgi:hypothetical protein